MTGVLPVALNKATRVVEYLLPLGKEYVCLMYLHGDVGDEKLHKGFEKFNGVIDQLPPKKSAVKRQWRKREIYSTHLLDREDRYVLFRIRCQSGTYIRKYVHDLGNYLKVGAHMTELLRTQVGPFNYKNWTSLHDLKDAYVRWKEEGDGSELKRIIVPMEKVIDFMPKIWVSDNAVDSLAHGASLSVPGIVKLEDNIRKGLLVAVRSLKDELVCIGESLMSSEEIMQLKKGLVLKTKKVFIDRGIYPKYKKEE